MLPATSSPAAATSAHRPAPAPCKNCGRCTPAPYLHSFTAALDQCKNQSWRNDNSGWIVTPTSTEEGAQALAGAAFCSGDCLYSYLFSRDYLSSKAQDSALHFFKRQQQPPPSAARAFPRDLGGVAGGGGGGAFRSDPTSLGSSGDDVL